MFYMYIAPPMAHAAQAFAVAAFLSVWLLVRERWSPAGGALLGGVAALMVMVREQDLLLVVTPAVDWALAWSRAPRDAMGATRARLLRAALAGAAVFAVGYAPQLIAYYSLNGYPSPTRLVIRKLNWLSPHGLEVLLSPEHGLFFWTPLALLALVGLAAGIGGRLGWAQPPTLRARRDGDSTAWVAAGLLLAVLSQVYIAGCVESWTVAGAFGQRRFVGLSAVMLVGLAALWPIADRRGPDPTPARAAVVALFVLGAWWNLGLMAQFGGGLMDRQRLTLADNAYHTFVTVPRRLPELVYRYVFARHSFYKPPAVVPDVPAPALDPAAPVPGAAPDAAAPVPEGAPVEGAPPPAATSWPAGSTSEPAPARAPDPLPGSGAAAAPAAAMAPSGI
jgi:hypothetical protein